MAFWNKKANAGQTFADIIRGMQYAVNTAHEMLERYHITILNKYFDAEGRAETKEIWIGSDKKMDIPLITLINQSSLSIDELEISFRAKIEGIALKSVKETDSGKNIEIERSAFEMNFTPSTRDGNTVDVRIKFKTTQPPEGVSRIIDEYTKMLEPMDAIEPPTKK